MASVFRRRVLFSTMNMDITGPGGEDYERRIRLFRGEKKPLRQGVEKADHNSGGRRCVGILQGIGRRIGRALSEPDQSLSAGLRAGSKEAGSALEMKLVT